MAKKHPWSYSMEFRQNIIDLARTGKKLDELATQFDLAPQTFGTGSNKLISTAASAAMV
jgi:transposase-like protein